MLAHCQGRTCSKVPLSLLGPLPTAAEQALFPFLDPGGHNSFSPHLFIRSQLCADIVPGTGVRRWAWWALPHWASRDHRRRGLEGLSSPHCPLCFASQVAGPPAAQEHLEPHPEASFPRYLLPGRTLDPTISHPSLQHTERKGLSWTPSCCGCI